MPFDPWTAAEQLGVLPVPPGRAETCEMVLAYLKEKRQRKEAEQQQKAALRGRRK